MTPVSKLDFDLCSCDGNAFVLLAMFSRAARKNGWSHEQLERVIDEATSADYDHLIATLREHCKSGDDDDD